MRSHRRWFLASVHSTSGGGPFDDAGTGSTRATGLPLCSIRAPSWAATIVRMNWRTASGNASQLMWFMVGSEGIDGRRYSQDGNNNWRTSLAEHLRWPFYQLSQAPGPPHSVTFP